MLRTCVRTVLVETTDSTAITVHRMTALEDTIVMEASTTELDDVIRLEDRYG